MRILLVDDEKDFALALAQRLELREVSCLLAHDAVEALRVLEAAQAQGGLPELVFLDVHLPGMNGVELLPLLRERHPGLDVVMLSGATELQTAVRAMRRGASNWLPKPVDVDALLLECRRAGERKRQRRREAQLAEAAMLGSLGRVAEGVAHEVNNPVNIMMQAAGWMEDLLADATHHDTTPPGATMAELHDALRTIRAQSLRVREITRRLLIFGKGLDASHAPLNMPGVVRQAVDMLAGQAAHSGVTVSVDMDAALPRPHGSAVELHQACVHVLENALEALPQGGAVRIHAAVRLAPGTPAAVSTENEDTAYLLHIEDNGPGMPPAVLAQAFEPFFSTKPKSAGLGLAVCRSLVRRQGGDVLALSPSPHVQNAPQGHGGGTRITLLLPLPA